MAAIEEGVRIFDPTRRTILNTDFSMEGLGYFLFQKYCECVSNTTECCDEGWRIVLAGSRFLQSSEQNYWPIVESFGILEHMQHSPIAKDCDKYNATENFGDHTEEYRRIFRKEIEENKNGEML